MSPSFTQSCSVSVTVKSPTRTEISLAQNDSYPLVATLAQIRATIVAASSTRPPATSSRKNCCSGRTTSRGTVRSVRDQGRRGGREGASVVGGIRAETLPPGRGPLPAQARAPRRRSISSSTWAPSRTARPLSQSQVSMTMTAESDPQAAP